MKKAGFLFLFAVSIRAETSEQEVSHTVDFPEASDHKAAGENLPSVYLKLKDSEGYEMEQRTLRNLSTGEAEALDRFRSFLYSGSSALEQLDPQIQSWVKKYVKGSSLLRKPSDLNKLLFMVAVFFPKIQVIDSKKSFYDRWLREKNEKPFVRDGILFEILPDQQALSSIAEFSSLKGKKVPDVYPEHAHLKDQRLLDDVEGWGNHRAVIARVGNINEGRIAFHEFAHFLHESCLEPADLLRIEQLYKNATASKKY